MENVDYCFKILYWHCYLYFSLFLNFFLQTVALPICALLCQETDFPIKHFSADRYYFFNTTWTIKKKTQHSSLWKKVPQSQCICHHHSHSRASQNRRWTHHMDFCPSLVSVVGKATKMFMLQSIMICSNCSCECIIVILWKIVLACRCTDTHINTHISVSAPRMSKHFSSMLVNIQINVQLLMYTVVVQKDPDHYWDLKNKYAARNYFCCKYRYKCHRVGGWHGTRIDAYSRSY